MTGPDEPTTPPTAAGDPETAALAITYLQAQLDQATGAYDSLDQKATLLPVFLAGAALLLVPSEGAPFTPLQVAFVVPALVTGTLALWFTVQALRTRKLGAGPDPKQVQRRMYQPLAEFSPALADVIVKAIEGRREALGQKAKAFNWAMYLAGTTLVLITLARLIGGFTVTQPENAQPSPAPSAPASAAPSSTEAPTPASPPTPTVAPTPTEAPAPSPSVQPSTSEAKPAPMFDMAYEEFGESWEHKGQTEPGPSEVRRAVEPQSPPPSDKSGESEPA